jgi:putative spermidine/putrescine transport system permease protein
MTRQFLSRAFLTLLAAYWLVPVLVIAVYAVSTSWRGTLLPEGFTLDAWTRTFEDPEIAAALGRSLLLGAVVVPLDLALVLPAAYWAVVRNPRITTVVQALAVLPFALPYVVIGAGIQVSTNVVAPQLFGTFPLLVLATAAVTFPFMYWTIEGAIASADAKQLTEAAMMCGAGVVQTLGRVILPAIKGGIVSGALLTFAGVLGEFALAKVLVGSQFLTLPLWSAQAMFARTGTRYDQLSVVTLFGFSVILAATVFVVYVVRATGAPSGVARIGKR